MLNISAMRDKKFSRSSRGYSCEEVDVFLEDIFSEIELLLKQNQESEDKILKLVDKVNEYREDEDAIKRALLNAEKQSIKIIAQAESESKQIIDSATIQSKKLVISTREEYNEELNKLKRLKEEVTAFKANLTDLYNSQLRLIMELPEVESDSDDKYMTSYDFNSEDYSNENENENEETEEYSEEIDIGYEDIEANAEEIDDVSEQTPSYSTEIPSFTDIKPINSNSSNNSGGIYYNPKDSRFSDLKFGNNKK